MTISDWPMHILSEAFSELPADGPPNVPNSDGDDTGVSNVVKDVSKSLTDRFVSNTIF